jgi:hypothetical protein
MTERNFRELVVYSMARLAETDVRHQVSFSLLNEQNDGILRLQRVRKPDAQICLSTGAYAKGDDHLVQHFLHYAADMDEMRSWLLDESNADEIIKGLTELSARVDKGFD